jgi:tetratricopeptide (TPR) repeat protein
MVSTKTAVFFLLAIALAHGQTPAQPSAAAPSLTPEQRGDVYMARKMYREAIATYKTGPQNSAVLQNKIGIAWHNLGDLNLARSSYDRAAKLDRKYADAINNAGTVLYAQKKYSSAVSRYKRALAIAPEKPAFWSNLGTAYFALNKYPEMNAAYAKAMALDPEIFEHRGSIGTQVQDLTVADRARYHFELARLYAKIGKDELALQYLRHCFEEGFRDKEKIRKAPEFSGMLENPQFIEVMALEPRVL